MSNQNGDELIDRFFGQYRFLSNFWPCEIEFEGIIYPSIEHAYVAAKTTDQRIRAQIAAIAKPGAVKKFGRTIVLRDDWEQSKIGFMRQFVAQKFAPGTELAQKLLDTGTRHLEEGNTWGDKFWGVCNGEGLNWLGRILMSQRIELKLMEFQQ